MNLFIALLLLGFSTLSNAQDAIQSDWHSSSSSSSSSSSPRPADQAYRDALLQLKRISSTSHVRPTNQQLGLLGYLKDATRSLFLSGPPAESSSLPFGSLRGDKLSKARTLLHQAAALDHGPALHLLADMDFFGNYSAPRNLSRAFARYKRVSELTGHDAAQHMVGFFYATGVGGVVEQDQGKAMLYYTFAAEQGNERAQMALAYRHHYGIGTPKDCRAAVAYWQKIAERTISWIRTGPPGNHALKKQGYRISDDTGGIYGEGASVSSAGHNAKRRPANSDAHANHEDVLEWLDLISRKGDVKATFQLGRMYHDGAKDVKPDYAMARKYFLEVTKQYWTKTGHKKSDVTPMIESLAARSSGFLGWMFLRGEGTEQNLDLARKWFKRGRSLGNAHSQYALGLMYLQGLSVPKDVKEAADLFSAAADQDNSAAQVSLGMLHMDAGDVKTAIMYFELAGRKGHVEALYYLAETEIAGIGSEPSCELASHHYKMVAERAEPIIASFTEANAAYEAGDVDLALLDFMLAAEQGFEVAQTNVAYLLDKARRRQKLLRFPLLPASIKEALPVLSNRIKVSLPSSLALLYWTRSARQSNIDALIKMGDYYLSGTGAPSSADKAAACYQAAAETMQSAQALWNLGWMYENGLGGHDQDFHLAKRFYDQALEINQEAYLPVKLALFKLRMRSRWNEWTRGSAKSIQEDPRPRRRKPGSLREWLSEFLAAEAEAAAQARGADDVGDADDNAAAAAAMRGSDWDAANPNLGDLTDDEVWAELLDGLVETGFILLLALGLIILIMYRRQRAERRAVEEQRARVAERIGGGAIAAGQGDRADEEHDRGLFPPQGDGEFMNWAVGGVGH
jgi:SEL1 protein